MEALEKLAGLAASTDAESAATIAAATPPDPNAPPPPAPPPGSSEVAADIVNSFAELVTSYAPDAAEIWTAKNREMSAAVLAPLVEKYNFSLERIPPELIAAFVIGPLLWKTSTAVGDKLKADRAEKAAAKRLATGGGAAAPAAADGAPAPAVHSQMGLYK